MTIDNFFGAPWIGANIDLLGRDELDIELNARYVPEWSHLGLPEYNTLAGNSHAWCSLRMNADLRKVGIPGTGSAAAASWSKWGNYKPFWFGSILDIEHHGGGRHVANFLYWVDEEKMICATLDGNKGNKFSVNTTNLDGSGDALVSGPRWPDKYLDGKYISKEEVLLKYPYFKIDSQTIGVATR